MLSWILLPDLLGITDEGPIAEPATGLRPRSMMRSYQHYVSDRVFEMEGSLMAIPMGMGKTVSTLDGVARLLEVNPTWKVLIVAPLQVSRFTWPDELGEWEHLKHLRYAVCCGTPEQRIAALDADAPITTINRENLPWLWEHIGGAIGWRWHILVYDESSRLKGFTTKTPAFKYKEGKKIRVKPNLTEFGVLVQARKLIKKVVLLSGTPAPNGLIDLGGQAKIIDQGARLGANKTAFLNRWFHVDRYSHTVEPKAHAEKEIMGLMKDVMIGLRAEDYIDLPPIFFNPIYVTLPPKVMKDYKQFKRDMVSMEYDVEAVSKGVLINKLLQFSSGGLYRSDPDVYPAVRETIPIHDEKYKALDSIIEEAAGNSVLVAYSFQFDKERLRKRYKNIVFFDEEPDFVRKWNRGEILLGAAHPASIGHGLNLQHGGYIQVWLSLTWSLELWDQFNRRLARPGQKNPTVFIHVIMARGTEDQRQYENLQTKGITQDRITENVRVRLGVK